MFQPSDVYLPRMNYNFSLPRLSNYGSLQNVTKGETSFISVDDGAENVMQSCSQSEAQEESTSIRVSQKRKVSILTSFTSLQMERQHLHMLIINFKIIYSKSLTLRSFIPSY